MPVAAPDVAGFLALIASWRLDGATAAVPLSEPIQLTPRSIMWIGTNAAPPMEVALTF